MENYTAISNNYIYYEVSGMKKALKRNLSLLLAMTIVFSSMYVGLSEVDFEGLFAVRAKAAGTSNLTFTLNSDGKSYSVTDCDTSVTGEIVIPDTYNGLPVTGIGYSAFNGCTNLNAIVIPESIKTIGTSAFYGCVNLKDVYAFDLAKWCEIEIYGDSYYSNPLCFAQNFYINGELITDLVIPDGVKSIGWYAFCGWKGLESVTIPDSVTSIGYRAFAKSSYYNDSSNWKNGLLYIGDRLICAQENFSGECFIDATTSFISEYAFESCKEIDSFAVDANNLYFIAQDGILYDKTGTTLVHYPAGKSDVSFTVSDNVVSVGAYAFNDCINLNTIIIPDSVTSLGEGAFYMCRNLETLVLPKCVDNTVFHMTFYLCDNLTSVVIPDGIEELEYLAFAGCMNLSSVVIPESVNFIESSSFSGCTNLVNVFYAGTEDAWENIIIEEYNDELLNSVIHYLTSGHIYDEYVYDYSNNTKTCECTVCGYVLTETISSLDYLTFTLNDDGTSYSVTDCDTSITGGLVIPDTYNGLPVTTIGASAFADCKTITEITIPWSITSIGNSAFSKCTGIEKIYWNAKSAADFTSDSQIFSNAGTSSTGVTVVFGDTVEKIPAYLFYSVIGGTNTPNITSVVFGNRITDIGKSSFYACKYLTSIMIPNSVENLGEYVFAYCSKLESVTLSNSITELPKGVFTSCKSLSTITIPDNITRIGDSAFFSSGLTYLEISDSVTSLGDGIFYSCDSLESVKLPNTITSIPYETFCSSSIKSIVIPDNVTTISERAFAYCDSIDSITIPISVYDIEYDGFFYAKVKNVFYEGTEGRWGSLRIDNGNTPLTSAKIHFGATGHTVEEWVVSIEATCTQDGAKTGCCSVCGEACSAVIPKLEHSYDYDNYEYVTNPENESECVKQHKCKDCDATTFGKEVYIAVRTVDDLYNVRNDLTANYVMLNDIDLTEATSIDGDYDFMDNGWNPIGSGNIYGANAYSGIFDGNGYKITGMRIDVTTLPSGTSSLNLGLFAYVTGTIKNLSVSGSIQSNAACSKNVGSIAGKLSGGTIENCHSYCVITTSNDYDYVGGIIGRIETSSNSLIKNCSNNNDIFGEHCVGGIVGASCSNASVSKCFNQAVLKGRCVGGIIGLCDMYLCNSEYVAKTGKYDIKLLDCFNSGGICAYDYAGGIIGQLNIYADFYTSINYSTYHDYLNFSISNSYNSGTLTGSVCAGIVGVYSYEISRTYYFDRYSTHIKEYIENCYNVGELLGDSRTASIVNYLNSGGDTSVTFDIITCYHLEGLGVSQPGGTALNNAMMKKQSAYVGFDFNNVWGIDTTDGYLYPQLINNPHRVTVCQHTYSDWVVDTEATCEADGSKHRTCEDCGEVETEVISTTGHAYSTEWTIDVAATCTTSGSKSHHCNNCGDKTDVTEIVATGHTVGEWVVTTDPTCSQEGEKTGFCGSCGEVCATEAVPTTEHNYDYDNYEYVQNPENPDEYHKQYECEDCGSTKLDENSAVIKSLIIESLPDKTTYVEGQAIDTTGLVVKLEFEDGTTEYITDYDIAYDNSVTGDQEVTVSFGNVTASFTVTFTAKNLVSIAVTKMPDKTTYVIGDTFDNTGMVVTATYDNGITEEVTGYSVSTLPQNAGTKNLMVSYGGKRIIIQVTVIEKKAVSMTVVDPERFEYILGDEFDPTGMVVTVTFNNGAVEEVTDYTIEGFGEFTGVGYVTLKYENLSYEIIILMHAPADFWTVETEATCTTDGVKHLYCTECGEIAKTEIIPATGHYCTETIIKNATCIEEGVKQFDCKHCDYSYTENFGGSHVISGEKVTLEPTCETEGIKYNFCSACGETVGEPIAVDALGHNYSDEFTIDVQATCSQPGSMSRHCSRCDAKTDVTVIESSVHDYTDWVVTTPAGCETDGERIRSCSGCGEYFTETIAALGHAYSIIWTTDKTPTCTVDGSKSHHCNRCGDKKDITVIPATGHSFSEWVLLEESTCTVNGQRVRMCSTCYMEDVEILTAPGHTNGEWTIDTKADCENDGSRYTNCTVCGTVVNETIKAYGHDYQSVFTVDKEATCTTEGSKSHHCSRCDSKTDLTVIQPLGHHISTMWTIDKDPTCESEGLKSHHCLRCDCVEDVTAIPVASHIYSKWYVVTEPTMDTEGIRAHKCYNCEMTEEDIIPKLLKYTVTFVADSEIVATVDFPEDATEISVPEVPHKDKYTGEWENFAVRNKNFTVNAIYTPIPAKEVEGIKANNSADYYSSTGEVEVNLNVSAPGRTIVTTTKKTVPLDIVFVLDQSGSMAENGKKEALKTAVRSFSNAILEDAKKYYVDHRIAVVGFASGNNDRLNYGNTELLTSSEVRYDKIKNSDYAASLVSVNDNGSLNSVITKAINNIDAEGATKADLGLEMASNIFANNPVTDNRQRVVVFLTDGVPTSYSNFEYSVANVAIQNAYQLKNTYDATVYSVGVFDENTSSDSKVNNFMNYVSSNYNEEVVMKRNSKDTTENVAGYYLDVTDVSSLSEVFTSIVEETTTHTTKFTFATLKYTLTNNFVLTSVQEDTLRRDAMEKLGVANDKVLIVRNANGTTTILIGDVAPWADGTNYVIDFTFRATANGNTLKSGTYQVGTFESGVILENGEGYEAVFAPNSVDITGTSGIAVFNINSVPYAINRLTSTAKVVAPATDFGADYNFIGWSVPSNLTLNNEVRVFEAELLKNEYKISWNIDGEITEVKYAVGDFITVPQVGNNSIGGAFIGWDKAIPETMPTENLTITALYDAHYHTYNVTKAFESCTEGGTLTYTCECGDTYTEQIASCEHSWEVITASNNQNSIENAGSRCSVCGIKDSKALRLEGMNTYQMADASYYTATVELDYVDENGIKHQPEGNIEISVQLDEVFEGDIPENATATVYRINDDGSRTILESEQKGMNMTFTTDHFSTYEFEFTTGTQKYLFAQPKSRIDYNKNIIFSDVRLAKDFKDFVSYLAPATVDENTNALGFMGTGSSITMAIDGVDTDYTVVINGDTNGDSVVDALDAAQVSNVSNGHKTIDGAYKIAADSNSDDIVDIEDYQAIVNKVVA